MFTYRSLCIPNRSDEVSVQNIQICCGVCEHTSVLTANCMCRNQG